VDLVVGWPSRGSRHCRRSTKGLKVVGSWIGKFQGIQRQAVEGCGEKEVGTGIKVILILYTKPVLEGANPNREWNIIHIKRACFKYLIQKAHFI
jgi:hypothetical protein